jgi:hypothetical protein
MAGQTDEFIVVWIPAGRQQAKPGCGVENRGELRFGLQALFTTDQYT